jgi:hypothetical protein
MQNGFKNFSFSKMVLQQRSVLFSFSSRLLDEFSLVGTNAVPINASWPEEGVITVQVFVVEDAEVELSDLAVEMEELVVVEVEELPDALAEMRLTSVSPSGGTLGCEGPSCCRAPS